METERLLEETCRKPNCVIPLNLTHVVKDTVLRVDEFLKRTILITAPRCGVRSELVVVADLNDVRGLGGCMG